MVQRTGESQYNPIYEFPYTFQGSNVDMVVTSVAGHLLVQDFEGRYSNWSAVDPAALFFEAKIITSIGKVISTTKTRKGGG